MKDLRIGAVIMRSVLGETSENLNRTSAWVRKAASQRVDLVCFPELNLTGYSVREVARSVAEPIPGPLSEAVVQMAHENGVVILAGLIERGEDGSIFASQLVAAEHGVQGIYRKCHLSPFEQSLYASGDAFPVFNVRDTTFGIELCYDTHFPEMSTLLTLKGAEILFCLHASPRGTPKEKQRSWMRHLTARAFDNGAFVVACNQAGDNNDGLQFPGLALTLNPSGEVINEDISGDEGILITDLSAAELAHVRENRMRHFLPNRRPELYGGLVKKDPF